MKISKNFNRTEFACKCGCGQDTVDIELITVLEILRNYFNASVTITSGNRCVFYNDFVGGKPRSYHLNGKAADIKVDGISPFRVYAYLVSKYPGQYGIGKYKTFTHIDVRSSRARW